jgi:hypothetical protein
MSFVKFTSKQLLNAPCRKNRTGRRPGEADKVALCAFPLPIEVVRGGMFNSLILVSKFL